MELINKNKIKTRKQSTWSLTLAYYSQHYDNYLHSVLTLKWAFVSEIENEETQLQFGPVMLGVACDARSIL